MPVNKPKPQRNHKPPVFYAVTKNDFELDQAHYHYKVLFQGHMMDITEFPVAAFTGAHMLQIQSIEAFMPVLIDYPENFRQGLNFLHDIWLAEANQKLVGQSTRTGRLVQKLAAKAMGRFADIYPNEARTFVGDVLSIKQQQHEKIVGVSLPPLVPRDLRGYMPRQFLDKACAQQPKPCSYYFLGIDSLDNPPDVLVLNYHHQQPVQYLVDIDLSQADDPAFSLDFIRNLEPFLFSNPQLAPSILHFLAQTWQHEQSAADYQTDFIKAMDIGGEAERVMLAFAVTHQNFAKPYVESMMAGFGENVQDTLLPESFVDEALGKNLRTHDWYKF